MTRRLVLASASPRRRQLLRGAGFAPEVLESDLDDALLSCPGATPDRLVAALAWFKVRRVLERYPDLDAVVLGADTVCVDGDRVLGKPKDESEARAMLRDLAGHEHRTLTGVAIVDAAGVRHLFVDTARVEVGPLEDAAIDAYVASGAWRGKAGGYNYIERVEAGWPVACVGDPTSVMGLPMRRTVPLLEELGVERCRQESPMSSPSEREP